MIILVLLDLFGPIPCTSFLLVQLQIENNKKFRQNITIFLITERKILAYRYFFSMSDEESHSESEFYYPEEEEQAKTEQNNMTKVITQGDENFSNSQEELQKFVQEQKSENTVKKTSRDMKCLYRFLGEINKTNLLMFRFCCTTRRPPSKSSSVVHEGAPWQK